MQTNESSPSEPAEASLEQHLHATPPVPPTPAPRGPTGPIPGPPAVRREINLVDIRLDTETQVRVKINDKIVGEYAERMLAGDKFPPAEVFFDGKGYYVADGFHRLLAAKRAKLTSYPCNVRPGGPDRALWFGLGANTRHGLRLTGADKRHALEMALGKFPEKTQNQIAAQIGCAQSYVAKVANELITGDKLKVPDHRKGKDGKIRPTRYRKTKQTEPQQAGCHPSAPASPTQPADAQSPTAGQPAPCGLASLNPANREFGDKVQQRFQKWMDRWAVADHPRVKSILMNLLAG